MTTDHKNNATTLLNRLIELSDDPLIAAGLLSVLHDVEEMEQPDYDLQNRANRLEVALKEANAVQKIRKQELDKLRSLVTRKFVASGVPEQGIWLGRVKNANSQDAHGVRVFRVYGGKAMVDDITESVTVQRYGLSVEWIARVNTLDEDDYDDEFDD